jgi:hypothetical protein
VFERFELFREVKIQVEVFWVLTSCDVTVGYLKMEAAMFSETLVSYRNTT